MNQNRPKTILDRDILTQIEDRVIESEGLTLKLFGFVGEIEVHCYSFPSSFNYDEAKAQLKKFGYDNSLSLLNSTYHKLGIAQLSAAQIERSLAGEIEYWYLHINFDTPIPLESQIKSKVQTHNFMIFLTDNLTNNDDGWRILYSDRVFFNYTKEFRSAVYIDCNRLEDIEYQQYQIAIAQVEAVVYGICQTLGIDIPLSLQSDALDRLIMQPPSLEDFESLLKLMTRELYDFTEYHKDARELFDFCQEESEEIDLFIEISSILYEYDATYYSDWKFDPEDIEYGISQILDEDFTFDRPEGVYSDDLFPYIQAELKKKELSLMNIDTCGDSYLFFIAKIADVDRILELAQTIDFKVEII
jgi:hypothetical protein